jgi:antirestriction protein ArdC
MSIDVYQIVTDRIIDALKKGSVPWHKPWSVRDGTWPRNAFSKRPYSGINVLLLSSLGYDDPRFATFKSIQKAGGKVKKGEKGSLVVFWRVIQKKDKDSSGKDVTKNLYFLRYYYVFNVAQTEGLKLPALADEKIEFVAHYDAVQVFENMPNRPPVTYGGDRAFYVPATDCIKLPKRESFSGPEAFYGTAFHELVHSTGHESRLNRHKDDDVLGSFGSAPYSREELVAEIGSAFVLNEVGITSQFDNNVAYVAGWLKALQDDEKMVVWAAGKAQHAADYILDRNQGEENDDA